MKYLDLTKRPKSLAKLHSRGIDPIENGDPRGDPAWFAMSFHVSQSAGSGLSRDAHACREGAHCPVHIHESRFQDLDLGSVTFALMCRSRDPVSVLVGHTWVGGLRLLDVLQVRRC